MIINDDDKKERRVDVWPLSERMDGDDHRVGKIVINLLGRLNKCGCISPRYDVKFEQYETWINRLLPSRQFGYLVITSSLGIMDHEEARRKHTGGKLLGFFY